MISTIENKKEKNKLIQFFQHPENYLLLITIGTLIFSFLYYTGSLVIDIFGFTVFIGGNVVCYLWIIILLLIWIAYKISKRFLLSKYLSWIHVGLTIDCIAYLLLSGKSYLKSKATDDLQQYLMSAAAVLTERKVFLTSRMGVAFVLIQILFLINLIAGLVKKRD